MRPERKAAFSYTNIQHIVIYFLFFDCVSFCFILAFKIFERYLLILKTLLIALVSYDTLYQRNIVVDSDFFRFSKASIASQANIKSFILLKQFNNLQTVNLMIIFQQIGYLYKCFFCKWLR